MMEKILTDNASEKIVVEWDEERFVLARRGKLLGNLATIILNPREMLDLIEFAGKCGGE